MFYMNDDSVTIYRLIRDRCLSEADGAGRGMDNVEIACFMKSVSSRFRLKDYPRTFPEGGNCETNILYHRSDLGDWFSC